MERLIKAGPPPPSPSPACLPACLRAQAAAEDMWKLKVPSGGGKDGRTDGEASFCMARARTTRGRRRAGAAEAVPGDFHNAVHIGLCDTNHLNSSNVSAIRVIISVLEKHC